MESKASHSWEERDVGGIVVLLQHENGSVDVGQTGCSQESSFLKEKSADWCWVQDDREGWVPQRGKGKWMFAKSELKRLEQDIVMLDHINEAQIVRGQRIHHTLTQTPTLEHTGT